MIIRKEIVNHIANNRADWRHVILSTYVLAQLDRIGHFKIEDRHGLPALWGHSFFRTFNGWTHNDPPTGEFMEGGIATTYYVVKALTHFQRSSGTVWKRAILTDIEDFFTARIEADGVGVRGKDGHGIPGIVKHLRHTCYGYLILADLVEADPDSMELRLLTSKSAATILKPLSANELLQKFISESWPVGGIASYIAARESLYNSSFGKDWPHHERQCWPDVREAMLDALAELSSTHLSVIGATKKDGRKALSEHLPYWHPIEDDKTLRLHSTLGCLSLVGKDIARRQSGQRRIKEIVKDLREHVMRDPPRAPQFSKTSLPSIAAACAMLKLVLGPWYEPSIDDRDFILHLINFIMRHWSDADVYHDYWTEFTAPILQIEELTTGLDTHRLIQEAEFFIDGCALPDRTINTHAINNGDKEFLSILDAVIPKALNLDRRIQ